MTLLRSRGGLRYYEKATALGAQTVRRGKAWPVGVLRCGWDAPAVFLDEAFEG